MIRIFKVEQDHLVELTDLQSLNLSQDVAWIDLSSPTLEEDRIVESFLKIDIPTKEDMQEIELSNQIYDEGGAEYMTMMAVAQVHLDEPVKSPVTFILFKNFLVTVHYNDLISLSQFVARAQKRNGVPMPSSHGLMMGITEAFINRIADSLELLGTEMDEVSNDIFRSKKITVRRKTDVLQVAIRKVGAKGDLLSMLRESLATIARMISHHHAILDGGDFKHLKGKLITLSRDVGSLNDHAGFMATKMNFLLDATLGMINLEQNQIIKIFSIAAVVFLPPTLVASIYGMNFNIMPELEWIFGYPFALILMIVTAILPILYFKKKGWL